MKRSLVFIHGQSEKIKFNCFFLKLLFLRCPSHYFFELADVACGDFRAHDVRVSLLFWIVLEAKNLPRKRKNTFCTILKQVMN